MSVCGQVEVDTLTLNPFSSNTTIPIDFLSSKKLNIDERHNPSGSHMQFPHPPAIVLLFFYFYFLGKLPPHSITLKIHP